jgi:hypothetical protein
MKSQTDEEKSKGTETNGNTKTNRSFSSDDMTSMMNACCMGGDGSKNMMGSMGRYCRSFMGAIWWFALIPILFAVSALILGYYLSPDNIVVLWMVGWGIALGIGILGLIAMRIFITRFRLSSCCGRNIREE